MISGMILDAIRLTLFPAMMAFAAMSDLTAMTITNKVSLILLGGFGVLAWHLNMPAADLGAHTITGLIVLITGLIGFSRNWVGGGDAKLAAMIALWLGPDPLPAYLIDAALLGGGLTLLIVQFRHTPLPATLNGWAWLARLHRANEGVPYGIALAIAALMVYPDTMWMRGPII